MTYERGLTAIFKQPCRLDQILKGSVMQVTKGSQHCIGFFNRVEGSRDLKGFVLLLGILVLQLWVLGFCIPITPCGDCSLIRGIGTSQNSQKRKGLEG